MLIGIIGLLVFTATVTLVLAMGRRAPSVMETRMREFRARAVSPVDGEPDLGHRAPSTSCSRMSAASSSTANRSGSRSRRRFAR